MEEIRYMYMYDCVPRSWPSTHQSVMAINKCITRTQFVTISCNSILGTLPPVKFPEKSSIQISIEGCLPGNVIFGQNNAKRRDKRRCTSHNTDPSMKETGAMKSCIHPSPYEYYTSSPKRHVNQPS